MKRNETNLLGISSAVQSHQTADSACSGRGTGRGKLFAPERWILEYLLRAAGNPPVRVVLWDGQEIGLTNERCVGRVYIRDRGAMVKLIRHPDLQFGELYTSGRIEVEGDLVACLEALYRTIPDFPNRNLLMRMLARVYLHRRNTLARARDNIHHHYDIGNDFYRLWLDKEMVYTCAYFPEPTMSLEAAQIAKMDHICRKLCLRPGDSVVEAGCGWGALALHMARHYGVNVRAFNISREQIAYAQKRAHGEGLDAQVQFIQGDYRSIRGEFDVFVSVGMLEHVGLTHYHELGEVMNRCLKHDGRGLIHSIGRNRPAPMNAWIEKYIFPGAYPPSLSEMMRLFEPWRFSVLDVENLRLHYAVTLREWLQRYESAVDRVAEMFDPPFVRAWRLYLAGSIAAFTTGELQLFQVVFTRQNNNQIPQSREFLYVDACYH